MGRHAFRGGLLIDGTGAAAISDCLVLVDDDKITYAGSGREIPDGYEIHDIAGKTIMPGLIDAHLHFSGNLTDMIQTGLRKTIFRKRWSLCSRPMSVWKQGLPQLGKSHCSAYTSAI